MLNSVLTCAHCASGAGSAGPGEQMLVAAHTVQAGQGELRTVAR